MVSNVALKKTGWVAAGLLATAVIAGLSLGAGWWLGYRAGLEVAAMDTAATLRREVEAASALRVGNPRTAALLLELGIDEHAFRLMEARNNPRVFGVLTTLQAVSPEHALGAAQLYRGRVVSPDPQGAAVASRLASLPKVPMPVTPALGQLHATSGAASPRSQWPSVETADVQRDGDTLTVFYTTLRTLTPLLDCRGHALDMNEVWSHVVKERLKDPAIRSIVLFPQDLWGTSVSFDFTARESGRWSAPAPCLVDIDP